MAAAAYEAAFAMTVSPPVITSHRSNGDAIALPLNEFDLSDYKRGS